MVHIPVRIRGKNKKTGNSYERYGHLAHTAVSSLASLQVPVVLSQDEKESRLKKMILEDMDDNSLLSLSDENFEYQADGAWKISKLTSKVSETTGEIETEATLNRPLGAGKPSPVRMECFHACNKEIATCIHHY